MLKSWRLSNFKSVAKPTTLELAPLTVFAGANSSGKSTVIQSMLLTAQTLQSPVIERPVVLNGHMARLGSFSDIVSGADEEAEIEIGFELELQPPDLGGSRSRGFRDSQYFWWGPREAALEIDCRYGFSMRGSAKERDVLKLQPRLERTSVEVLIQQDEGNIKNAIDVVRSNVDVPERLQQLELNPRVIEDPDISVLDYEIEKIFPPSLERRGVRLAKMQPVGVSMRHFLPSRLTVIYDVVETEVDQFVNALTATGTLSWRELETHLEGVLQRPKVRSLISDVLRDFRQSLLGDVKGGKRVRTNRSIQVQQIVENLIEAPSGEHFQDLMRRLPPPQRGQLAGLFSERESELREAVRAGRGPNYELSSAPSHEGLGLAVASLQRFFASSVRYLGPLRDEPKAVYPLSGVTDPSDVGFKGEHTAAVLDIHRSTDVQFISPQHYAEEEPDGTVTMQTDPLEFAVQEWLDYMGVGTEIETVDRGKLGHELKVATSGDAPLHDLTQVGVGVSQVLPILVLSLLSDRGSTLIFEQPELHLHPKVQTRLADFFVSLTQLGKQCIVETHSEYMINRLRYRAAVSEGESVSSAVRIYFVEKIGVQSTFRSVDINQYGVIEDWPSGFFDERDQTAARVLRAGMRKRKSQREE